MASVDQPPAPEPVFEEFVDPVDGVRWRVDVGFLGSSWTCTWGQGCVGILDQPAADKQQGCCSVGAELLDDDEARTIAALGLTLDPDRFQHHRSAADGGVLADQPTLRGRPATRVVDGACIFFNRPGFAGGVGCALHLAAADEGESPSDWKPSVCWQLPLKVDEAASDDGSRVLRRWQRHDWGAGGATMAWCCTEGEEPSAYVGDQPTAEHLAEELAALVGPEVAVAIRSRINREDR
jgi:hypothetical protein